MQEINILVPDLPESVNNAIIIKWNKNIGDLVLENEVIAEIETDKIVLEIPSPQTGYLISKIFEKNEKVKSQEIIGRLSYDKAPNIKEKINISKKNINVHHNNFMNTGKKIFSCLTPSERRNKYIKIKNYEKKQKSQKNTKNQFNKLDNNCDSLDKIIKKNFYHSNKIRKTKTINMSPIREKITERLRFSQQNMVMLTTFNEVNLSGIINIRKKYQENFLKKFQIKLGYMSFFVKAVTQALQEFPDLNASIKNKKIIYHEYYDINIAISTNRGLITPILKDTNLLSMSDIEKKIKNFSKLGETGKLSLHDLQSGTFTITNGGVFGSLLSTPIINPPQVAILGMHFIKNRPMVSDQNIIKILPMMYLALSYDHQIIDGKQAIEFLNYIKNIIEDFSRITLGI